MLFTSRSGRAYPDVAAQASGFQVVVGGKVQSVGGTSASCPVGSLYFFSVRMLFKPTDVDCRRRVHPAERLSFITGEKLSRVYQSSPLFSMVDRI